MKIAWLFYGDHLAHPFIQLGARSLVENGHSVTVYDLSSEKRTCGYRHLSVPVNLSPEGLRSRMAGKLSYLRWLLTCSPGLARETAVIVTMPHSAPAAAFAKVFLGARIVYYPFELFGEQAGSVSIVWKHLERWLLTSIIDALITQNDQRAEVYRDERSARVAPVVVHNYKPAFPAVPRSGRLRARLGLSDSEKIVLYEGVLVHGRWLDRLIASVRHYPAGMVLVLMGEAMPWWEREGKHLAADPRVADRIRIAPFVPHAELPDYVADADAGIIIYDDTCRNNFFCEPGKLSDYVRAGVPVIAPDFPTLGPVVRRYKIGGTFSAPTPEKIAEAILRVLDAPSLQWAPGLRQAASELVWETQEPAFLKAVTGGVCGSRPLDRLSSPPPRPTI